MLVATACPPIPVMQMLQPDTHIGYLCLDNDKVSHDASERMAEQLRERGVMTERLVPELKDWNEDTLHTYEEIAPCRSLCPPLVVAGALREKFTYLKIICQFL